MATPRWRPRCGHRAAAPDAERTQVRRLLRSLAMTIDRRARGWPRAAWLACGMLLLAARATAATLGAAPFEDTIAQRVLACTGCHGREGRAGPDGYYPRIAGKPAGYLFNQLRNFRDERRHYELMNGLLALLDDDYLREIAAYFAGLDLPYPPPARSRRAGRAARAGRGARAARRRGARAARVQRLPRRADDRSRAVHPGVARLAARLHQRAARGVAQRPAPRRRTRLHGRSRAPPRAGGDRRGVRVARGAAGARACGCGFRVGVAVAAGVRRHRRRPRTRARREEQGDEARAALALVGFAAAVALGAALVVWLNRDDAGDPSASSAPGAEIVVRGEYLVRAGSCFGCHTEPGGAPYAGGRAIETPFGIVHSPEPDSRRDRPRGLEQRRLLARAAQRPRPRRAAALPGVSLPELHAARARRQRCDVRVPEEPRTGREGEPAERAPLPVRPAGSARGVARAVLPAGPVRNRHRALAAVEPRRLPGRNARPLQRVPLAAQRVRRDRRPARPRGRADPDPELVRAVALRQPRSRRRRLAGERGRRVAEGRRLGDAARCRGRWPKWSRARRST